MTLFSVTFLFLVLVFALFVPFQNSTYLTLTLIPIIPLSLFFPRDPCLYPDH